VSSSWRRRSSPKQVLLHLLPEPLRRICATVSKLDFGHSCSVAEGSRQAIKEGTGDVHHILVARGCVKTVVSPEFAAYGGKSIGERWPDLRIPRSFQDVLRGAVWEAVLCEQRHQREQPEERWGGATDRRIRPLPLRLQTEVTMCFLEGLRFVSSKPAA